MTFSKLFAKTIFIIFIMSLPLFIHANRDTFSMFEYDSSKMNAETMYTYAVSNFEEDLSMLMYVYFVEENQLEFYKDYSTVSAMVLYMKEEFNTEYFMLDKVVAENPFSYLKIPKTNLESKGNWNFDRKRLETILTYFDKDGKKTTKSQIYEVPTLPTFDLSIYQFDYIIAMRHYVGTKNDIFRVGGFYAGNNNDAKVLFEKVETIDGRSCDKWVIQGLGFITWVSGYKQEFWFDNEDPYYKLIQYKNHMSNIIPFGNVKMVLKSVERNVSYDEWQAKIETFTETARTRLGYDKPE